VGIVFCTYIVLECTYIAIARGAVVMRRVCVLLGVAFGLLCPRAALGAKLVPAGGTCSITSIIPEVESIPDVVGGASSYGRISITLKRPEIMKVVEYIQKHKKEVLDMFASHEAKLIFNKDEEYVSYMLDMWLAFLISTYVTSHSSSPEAIEWVGDLYGDFNMLDVCKTPKDRGAVFMRIEQKVKGLMLFAGRSFGNQPTESGATTEEFFAERVLAIGLIFTSMLNKIESFLRMFLNTIGVLDEARVRAGLPVQHAVSDMHKVAVDLSRMPWIRVNEGGLNKRQSFFRTDPESSAPSVPIKKRATIEHSWARAPAAKTGSSLEWIARVQRKLLDSEAWLIPAGGKRAIYPRIHGVSNPAVMEGVSRYVTLGDISTLIMVLKECCKEHKESMLAMIARCGATFICNNYKEYESYMTDMFFAFLLTTHAVYFTGQKEKKRFGDVCDGLARLSQSPSASTLMNVRNSLSSLVYFLGEDHFNYTLSSGNNKEVRRREMKFIVEKFFEYLQNGLEFLLREFRKTTIAGATTDAESIPQLFFSISKLTPKQEKAYILAKKPSVSKKPSVLRSHPQEGPLNDEANQKEEQVGILHSQEVSSLQDDVESSELSG
jgi:hypothetical protein